MPFEHDMGDSAPEINREQTGNWRSIGEISSDMLVARYRVVRGETCRDIAIRKAGEVVLAMENDDLTGARMAADSLSRFLAEYTGAK